MDDKMIKNIAACYGTPAYVFEESLIDEQIGIIRENIQRNISLCFAMKANPFLTGIMSKKADRLEVCSPGEYEICIREQVNPDKIIISGVNKTPESMDRIFSYSHGNGIFTIESKKHYELLKKCAVKYNTPVKVLLRLSSGNQFGMDKETLVSVLEDIGQDKVIIPIGIHYYSGTQKKMKKIEKELAMLDEFGKYLKENFELPALELEYGPGLMVTYFENEPEADAKQQLAELSVLLENITGFDSIAIEMGRFLVSCCGTYLTRINDIKHTAGCSYIIVDGGIHQLGYYGQMMGMKKPFMKIISDKTPRDGDEEKEMSYNICGSLCTVNDVIVRDVPLKAAKEGDIISFGRCGAYSVTEGMALFLSRELPAVIYADRENNQHILRNITQINYLNSTKGGK